MDGICIQLAYSQRFVFIISSIKFEIYIKNAKETYIFINTGPQLFDPKAP